MKKKRNRKAARRKIRLRERTRFVLVQRARHCGDGDWLAQTWLAQTWLAVVE